jgi:preprotein translocase subunit SecD
MSRENRARSRAIAQAAAVLSAAVLAGLAACSHGGSSTAGAPGATSAQPSGSSTARPSSPAAGMARIELAPLTSQVQRPTDAQLKQSARVLRARLTGAGIPSVAVVIEGDRIAIDVPRGKVDQALALSMPALLRIRPVKAGPFPTGSSETATYPGVTGADLKLLRTLDCRRQTADKDHPDRTVAVCDEEGEAKYLLGPAIIEGTEIAGAEATHDTSGSGGWQILFTFTSGGQQTWTGYTAKHNAGVTPGDAGNSVAFVVDGRVLSAPEIQDTITGPTSITGKFTRTSATDLANALKSGALPLSFTVQSVVPPN